MMGEMMQKMSYISMSIGLLGQGVQMLGVSEPIFNTGKPPANRECGVNVIVFSCTPTVGGLSDECRDDSVCDNEPHPALSAVHAQPQRAHRV